MFPLKLKYKALNYRPKLLISRTHQTLSKINLRKRLLQRAISEEAQATPDSTESLNNVSEESMEKSLYKSDHIVSIQDSWNLISQVKKQDLYELLWSHIKEHRYTDVFIHIGNITFKCHFLVFHCYTNLFALHEREHEHVSYVHVNDVQLRPLSVMKLYNWMLNSEVQIGQQDILDLFVAAEALDIEELKNQCWMILDDSSVYCEHIAYEMYKLATQSGIKSIRQLMMPRICKYFLPLIATEDFLCMETDEVCQWFDSNAIAVNTEMEIFFAAVLWVNSKWKERKRRPLKKVMNCVRFGLIPPWFLVSMHTTATTKNPDVERVIRNSHVKRLIADGLSLTTTMIFYSKNPTEFDDFLQRSKLKIPTQRKWLVDESCNYHYCEGTQVLQHICYEAFVEYLQSLRVLGKHYWRNFEWAPENHWPYICNIRPNSGAFNLPME